MTFEFGNALTGDALLMNALMILGAPVSLLFLFSILLIVAFVTGRTDEILLFQLFGLPCSAVALEMSDSLLELSSGCIVS